MGTRNPMVIDTDAGSDDAVALLMALSSPSFTVEAITVVAGNVPCPQAVQNALYTLELAGSEAPVYSGCSRPLLRPLETAQFVHGEDGMGDIGLPLVGREPTPGHAVDALVELGERHAGELTLVTLGPLTNVALALRRAPELREQLARVVVMGGTGSGHGNVTPVAEYNFWVDPEAARVVFESGLPLTMVGWDISRTVAVVDPELEARLAALDTPRSRFALDIQRCVAEFTRDTTKLEGFDLPDPIAMAIALDPAIAESEHWHVAIAVDGLCRGQSVVDRLAIGGAPPNAHVVTRVDRERFVAALEEGLR